MTTPVTPPAALIRAPVRDRRGIVAVLILAIALAARLYIAAQGGALYWTDEKRYLAAREAVGALLERDGASAAHWLLSASDHIGFRWLALIPAAIERGIYGAEPPHAKVCAGFLALFSVANLYLIWRIARRVSTHEWEAEVALLFAACSNALFFFSRHCFPYDAALTFLLLAVLIAAGRPSRFRPLRIGLLCGIGYLVYNGYWSVGAVILILEVTGQREPWRRRLERSALALAGLFSPMVMVFGLARLCGYDLLAHSLSFADTVNQGDFGEGWRFWLEYLLVADGPLAAGLLILAGAGTWLAWGRPLPQPWLRWVGVLVLLLAIWITLSDVVRQFVLYGRTVRAAIPFLALAAAGAAGFLWSTTDRRGRVGLVLGGVIICVAGSSRMLTPLRQVFPAEFRALAEQKMAAIRHQDSSTAFRTLFAHYIDWPEFPPAPPAHREVLRHAHPHRYLPYLFEGYTRAQRPLYLGHDTAMRLIQLDPNRGLHDLENSRGSEGLAPYPGPLAVRLRLPRNPRSRSESLVRHGPDGADGDLVFIEYADDDHVRIGFRRDGTPPMLSAPLACDYAREHVLTVSLGSFYPPRDRLETADARELASLCERILIRLDGETAVASDAKFPAIPMSGLRLGKAAAQVDGTVAPFSGEILSVRQIDPRNAADAEWYPPSATLMPGADFPGPLRLEVRFPAAAQGRSEPLVSTGVPGAADLLFVTYVDEHHVRFGLDHWGGELLVSPLVGIQPGATQEAIVSMGSLFPRSPTGTEPPGPLIHSLHRRIIVRLNGETVWSRVAEFHPAASNTITIGRCTTGATTAAPTFGGEIRHSGSSSLEALGLPAAHPPPVRGPHFGLHHGVVEMSLKLPRGAAGVSEPLLVSGQTGVADTLFITYVDAQHIRLGLDHWGAPVLRSPPIAIRPDAAHRLVVSLGSLFPPQTDSSYAAAPDARTLAKWLYVRLNDQVVFSQPGEFFDAAPDEVSFGRNRLGGTTTDAAFTGTILALARVAPASLGLTEQALVWPPVSGPRKSSGHTGTVELAVQLPDSWDPGAEPLLISGAPPQLDAVFVRYRGGPSIQIGYRRGAGPTEYSAPIPSGAGRSHRIRIALRSLYPENEAASVQPRISVDGQAVLTPQGTADPAAPGAVYLGVDYFALKGLRRTFAGKLLGAELQDDRKPQP